MEHSDDCSCEENDRALKRQLESMGVPPEEIVAFMAIKNEHEGLLQRLCATQILSDRSKLALLSGFLVTQLRVLRNSTGDDFPFSLMNILKSVEGEDLHVFLGKDGPSVKPEEMH